MVSGTGNPEAGTVVPGASGSQGSEAGVSGTQAAGTGTPRLGTQGYREGSVVGVSQVGRNWYWSQVVNNTRCNVCYCCLLGAVSALWADTQSHFVGRVFVWNQGRFVQRMSFHVFTVESGVPGRGGDDVTRPRRTAQRGQHVLHELHRAVPLQHQVRHAQRHTSQRLEDARVSGSSPISEIQL